MKKNISNIYFTSDLHFGHKNILKFCKNRKCKTLREMESKLIRRWNGTVKQCDTVIVVGDVFLGHSAKFQKMILSKLHGKKILVKGNHDKSNSQMMNLGFAWSCDEMTLNIQGELVKISHYPYKPEGDARKHDLRYLNLRPSDDGSFLIHGHTHSTEKINGRMIHVGTDAWNLTPVSINKIASIINNIKKEEQKPNIYAPKKLGIRHSFSVFLADFKARLDR